MPPKKAPDTRPPGADPNALLFLSSAAAVYPRAEVLLDSQTSGHHATAANALLRVKEEEERIVLQVRRHHDEQDRWTKERDSLRRCASELERAFKEENEKHKALMASQAEREENKIREIEAQILLLRKDAAEAAEWLSTSKEKKTELENLRNRIEELDKTQKSQIKTMLDDHEELRRRLRDVLVRKLRQLRDHMTSEQYEEECEALKKVDNVDTVKHNRDSGATKHNERLSREVTIYERETKITASQISSLETERGNLLSALKQDREKNEHYSFKNAAHLQSLKLLKEKLNELKQLETTTALSIKRSAEQRLAQLKQALASELIVRQGLEEQLTVAIAEKKKAESRKHEAASALLAQATKDEEAYAFTKLLIQDHKDSSGEVPIGENNEPLPLFVLGIADESSIVRFLNESLSCLLAAANINELYFGLGYGCTSLEEKASLI